jgi:hypothetical protein
MKGAPLFTLLAQFFTLPPLRPPRGLLDPTFWQAHAFEARAAAGVLALAALFVLGRRLRPRAEARPNPAAAARAALLSLRGRPEDAALAGEAARTVRRCAADLLGRRGDELTTDELLACARSAGPAWRALAGVLETFLRDCDRARFDARPGAAPGGVLQAAEGIVDRCAEAGR